MPRPSAFTEEIHAAIVKALKFGNTRRASANIAGVSERTFRNWMERGRNGEEPYASFEADVLQAEASIEQVFTLTVLRAAKGTDDVTDESGRVVQRGRPGDYRAAQFWLERRRAEYRQKNVNIDFELERMLNVIEDVCGKDKADEVFAAFEREDSGEEDPE